MNPLKVGQVEFGGKALGWILGPCVIESLDLCRVVAERLAALGVPYVFKGSFDKANRSSRRAERGPGLDEGLHALEAVRAEFGVPVTTDVHETAQVPAAAQAVDMLQIPAFLCRQTDLLLAAAETGLPVNVKKGQFLSPQEAANAVEKAAGAGGAMLTERGTTFGYHNLVVDMRAFPAMRSFGVPVAFDATHSVQRPGGLGASTGGDREFVPVLARAAVAAGADGLFLETHPDPDRAPCDGPNMLPLDDLPALASAVLRIREALAADAPKP